MASPYRRSFLSGGGDININTGSFTPTVARPAGQRFRDARVSATDITDPTYLTTTTLGPRFTRTMTGRGTFEPGYTIIGTQPGALVEGLVIPRVLKMVSPLTGQGPADPRATGYFANMNLRVVQPRIVRKSRSVPPNRGYKVVYPPRNAIRRLDTRGQGTVGYW